MKEVKAESDIKTTTDKGLRTVAFKGECALIASPFSFGYPIHGGTNYANDDCLIISSECNFYHVTHRNRSLLIKQKCQFNELNGGKKGFNNVQERK